MNRIANPALMIKMLRDAGYKNTSYAVAELVDNSIEAKAKNIKIALFENQEKGLGLRIFPTQNPKTLMNSNLCA